MTSEKHKENVFPLVSSFVFWILGSTKLGRYPFVFKKSYRANTAVAISHPPGNSTPDSKMIDSARVKGAATKTLLEAATQALPSLFFHVYRNKGGCEYYFVDLAGGRIVLNKKDSRNKSTRWGRKVNKGFTIKPHLISLRWTARCNRSHPTTTLLSFFLSHRVGMH